MSDDAPKISVALPARNASRTVANSVRSILSQSFSDFELIFLDDGSSDCTFDIISGFSDDRIRIVSDGQLRGLTFRLNQAIEMARGQYFARMDADDISFPDRLAKQFAFMEAHPAVDLVGCRVMLFNDEGEPKGYFPLKETHAKICRHPWRGFDLAHPTWFGRIDWFKRFGYRDVLRAEDQDLLLRSYRQSCFACIPEVLFAYRLGSASLGRRLQGRKALFSRQFSEFIEHRELGNLGLVSVAFVARIMMDMVGIVPGFGRAHMIRRDVELEDADLMKIRTILSTYYS
jgi:glycosyltransferase involved in cell wall biosynthesis